MPNTVALETPTKSTFVPLREYLLGGNAAKIADGNTAKAAPCHPEEHEVRLEGRPERAHETEAEITDAISAARRFHVAITETVERSVDRVLHEITCEVLGRELALAPIDTAAIVRRILTEMQEEAIVRVRIHPDDRMNAFDDALPLVTDAALSRGDVIFEVRDGTLDARLGVRIEHALQSVRVA